MLCSTYSTKDTLSIFRVKSEQEWEFKLPLKEIYVRLGIIEQEARKAQDKQFDKHSKYLEDGRIPTRETIFEEKKAIEIETLFEHESLKGKEKKRVYIQGAAGSGKSTLCHYIAYHWAKGNLWTGSFKYLFWIPLRNLTRERYPGDKTYTPFDLIIKEYEGEIDLREFQTYLEQPDVRHQTLILLDGYDELSSDVQRDTISLVKAFNKLKEVFPHLLITSRPGPCSFAHSCDLELLGFDRQGITDYIEKFFTQVQGEEKKKKLQHVLTHSPHALSLAHIPINLTLLCSLFNEDPNVFDSSDSITMTFIYDRIVNQMYKWFMLRQINQKPLEQSKETILASTNLRSNKAVKGIAQVLEEMAFFMMEQDSLYLNKEEIEKEFTNTFTSDDLTHCGLLRLPAEKGYFIHLTFQEFLTASKLANEYLEEKNRKGCQDFIRKNKFEPRYSLIFRMIAGYLSIHTAANRRRSHVLQTFFDDLFAEPHDLAINYELNLLAECFEECHNPSQIKQHPGFIEVVTEYITKLIRLGLGFRLLNKKGKLLNHPEVIATIQHLLDDPTTVEKMLKFLSGDGIAGQKLAPELIKSILNLLKMRRHSAAIVLRTIAQQEGSLSKEAVEALINLLKIGDSIGAKISAVALGAVAQQEGSLPKEAVEALINLLIEGDVYVKSSAADALGAVAQQGDSLAKEALIQILKEGDSFAKISAAQVLEKVAEQRTPLAKEALEALIHLVKEGDDEATNSAADALGKVAQQRTSLAKEALKALIQLLKEGDDEAKRSAAVALGAVAQQGGLFPKEAVEALIQALKEGDDEAKSSAADALRTVAEQGTPLPKEAVEVLIQLLKEGDSITKISAAVALGAVAQQGGPFPKEAVEALIQLLKKGDYEVKSSAAVALGAAAQQGSSLAKQAVEALIQFFIKADSFAKSFAAQALAAVAKQGVPLAKEAVEALIQILKRGNSDAKSSAAVALGAVAQQGISLPKEALEALIQFLKEGDPFAKRSAVAALRAINKGALLRMSTEAIPLIAEVCFFSDNSFSIQDKQFQISDQRTIYPSTVEIKLYYEEIRESLPEVLAKWRKQLDGLSFNSTPIQYRPLYH